MNEDPRLNEKIEYWENGSFTMQDIIDNPETIFGRFFWDENSNDVRYTGIVFQNGPKLDSEVETKIKFSPGGEHALGTGKNGLSTSYLRTKTYMKPGRVTNIILVSNEMDNHVNHWEVKLDCIKTDNFEIYDNPRPWGIWSEVNIKANIPKGNILGYMPQKKTNKRE